LGRIGVGDKLFLKVSSGPVCARGTVKRVLEFENLSPGKMRQLRRKYNGLILGSDEYWAEKRDSRYGVLVWLEGVERIEPVRIEKKDWRAWVVLGEGEDFGLCNLSI
jgi:phage terminase large subunit-like protein